MSRPKAALSDEDSPHVGSLGPTDIAQLSGMSVAFNSYLASSLA